MFSLDTKGLPDSWMHQTTNDFAENYLTDPKHRSFFLDELFNFERQNTLFDDSKDESIFFPIKTLLKFYKMWLAGTASIFDWLFILMASLVWPFLILEVMIIIYLTLKSKNYHD